MASDDELVLLGDPRKLIRVLPSGAPGEPRFGMRLRDLLADPTADPSRLKWFIPLDVTDEELDQLCRLLNDSRSRLRRGSVLRLQSGLTVQDPSEEQISDLLVGLSGPSEFAILSRAPDTYIQTRPAGNGLFRLEYQDGGLDRHFAAASPPEREQVVAAFQGYQRGDDAWRRQLEWVRLDLT